MLKFIDRLDDDIIKKDDDDYFDFNEKNQEVLNNQLQHNFKRIDDMIDHDATTSLAKQNIEIRQDYPLKQILEILTIKYQY